MKNMLESFKKDHQVKESLKIKNLVLSTEFELGYWWEQNDEKKKTKMNLLNEKCSLIQRGVRVPI